MPKTPVAGTVEVWETTGDGRRKRREIAIAIQDDQLVTASRGLGIPISALRQPTGIPLVAAETAGTFNVSIAANVHIAQGEISDNETEVSVCHAQVVLPPDYADEGDLTVRLSAELVTTGAGNDNGSTLDLSVYKQAAGAVGSDLVETAAQTFTAQDAWEDKDFVITPTGLAAGDVLNLVITASVIDDEAGAGTLRLSLQPPLVLVDVTD